MFKNKTYRYRIYPNKEQQIFINQTIGCSRFVFNHFLHQWTETYQKTGKGLSYNTCSSLLTRLKKEEETRWLKEADSIALQSSIEHLADGFERFFKKQTQYPRFKSKKNPVQSYTTKQTNGNIAISGNQLKLPKVGWFILRKAEKLLVE